MIYIDDQFIKKHSDFIELINSIKEAFCRSDVHVPKRHHLTTELHDSGDSDSLLIMPAWNNDYQGVKIVSVNPLNSEKNIPTIQGVYIHSNKKTGELMAILDGKSLTTFRTAAVSALASSYLSRRNSRSLLMMGTGALAPALIKAHCQVRPIDHVFIWGRNYDKAQILSSSLSINNVEIQAIENIHSKLGEADIISCATLAETPILLGENIVEGQHIDLVGSFKPTMRETDSQVVQKASIYIDTEMAILESGDLHQPISNGVISKDDILGDLFDLCKSDDYKRQNDTEITLFKSVGYALEDLAASEYYYNKYLDSI